MKADQATGPAPADDVIGGKYRIIRLLGRGGMGTVYEAENTWTRRRVAVKVMHPEVALGEESTRRFRREAQAAALLGHPNIVEVLDMGQDPVNGSLYIVQEFLTGTDLARHLRAVGRMSPATALAVIAPVMEALVAAHERGIIHRDLKPDNIFLSVTARGVVPKVIDFGIAKVIAPDHDAAQRTLTGVMLGTPYYMSPEQVSGDTSIDARTDVWSLGVVLYEMLAGQRPFPAARPNMMLAMILRDEPTPLAAAAPDVPADLAAAVMGALARDRDQRHPTMRAFLDAVRAGAGAAEAVAPDAVAPGVEPTSPPAVSGVRESGPRGSRDWSLDPSPAPARDATRYPTARNVGLALGVALACGVAGAAAGFLATAPRAPTAHTTRPAAPPPVTPVAVQVPRPAPSPPATVDAGAAPGASAPTAIGGGRREPTTTATRPRRVAPPAPRARPTARPQPRDPERDWIRPE